MVNIPPTSANLGFASPVFFKRTGRIRERVVDCSREELIDLAFFQLGMLERTQGTLQLINDQLETHLGYNETLKLAVPHENAIEG